MRRRIYADRYEAGRVLARRLQVLAGRDDVIVLGLPRGGVPVAAEIAAALSAPLDIVLVRKLGAPRQAEVALGAIASGGVRVLNEDIVARLGILPRQIEHIAELETRELHRRETVYRGGRPLASLAGRTVILADDGLATGATMRAAVVAVRAQKPAAIIVAVPVGAPETVASIGESVDRIECPEQPDDFLAVGEAYEEFEPTTDQEVFDLLHRERGAEPPAR